MPLFTDAEIERTVCQQFVTIRLQGLLMRYILGALAASLAATQAGAATLSVSSLLPAATSIAGKVGGSDPCPEPATWALMLVGFAALAVATRLRRKVKA